MSRESTGSGRPGRRRTFLCVLTLAAGVAITVLGSVRRATVPTQADSTLGVAALSQALVSADDLNGAFSLTAQTANANATVTGLGALSADQISRGAYLAQVDGSYAPTDRAPQGVTGLQASLLAFRSADDATLFFNRLADSAPNQVAAPAPVIGDARALVLNAATANQSDARVIARRGNAVFGIRVQATPPASAIGVAIDAARAQTTRIDAILSGATPAPAVTATATASPVVTSSPLTPTSSATSRPAATVRSATPAPTPPADSDEDPPQPSL